MPQLSFNKDEDLHEVRITIREDSMNLRTTVHLIATARSGRTLASSGITITKVGELELIPELLREVAMGWIYGGPREAITSPAEAHRLRRRLLGEPIVG